MLRRALCTVGVCLLVSSVAPCASAQERGALPVPLAEAAAGYAFMRDTTTEENFPAGWYFSAAANLTRWFGLTGEISGAHKKLTDFAPFAVKANLYTFMGGPRFFIQRGRIVPFAQVLAGAAQFRWNAAEPAGIPDASGTDTKFAFQPGGGMTVLLTENVSVRGAVDYRRIVFTDADEFDEDNSQVRAIAGIVFGWGAR
jgi:opacity protein-like surface antigen